jgi:hypothetical protein
MSGVARDEVKRTVLEIAEAGSIGEFLIRDVESLPSALGLCAKLGPNSVATFPVLAVKHKKSTPLKLQVEGCKEKFANLSELVTFYAAKKSKSLGVQLIIPEFGLFERSISSPNSHGESSPHVTPLTPQAKGGGGGGGGDGVAGSRHSSAAPAVFGDPSRVDMSANTLDLVVSRE